MDLTGVSEDMERDPQFRHFANTVAALSALHDLIADIPMGSLRYKLQERFSDLHSSFVAFADFANGMGANFANGLGV